KAQGYGRKAQGYGRKAQGYGRKAQGYGHKAQVLFPSLRRISFRRYQQSQEMKKKNMDNV
uniref:hypothetical protein n=1 Tax=uncultured Bacteroides sp. TaxID=162156 RepID=UPI00261AC845